MLVLFGRLELGEEKVKCQDDCLSGSVNRWLRTKATLARASGAAGRDGGHYVNLVEGVSRDSPQLLHKWLTHDLLGQEVFRQLADLLQLCLLYSAAAAAAAADAQSTMYEATRLQLELSTTAGVLRQMIKPAAAAAAASAAALPATQQQVALAAVKVATAVRVVCAVATQQDAGANQTAVAGGQPAAATPEDPATGKNSKHSLESDRNRL
ncbi:hypothetical protein EBH_0044170 [Eimeria brunetti]|uniref:Uncharacterized protein n=1 Tax=Eimeria brunetti TaxID=51314 RepID=U6LVV4_9EIME|nr:hypothetical protein EBH_0044170 [Eimeria brunetti]